MNIFTAPVPKKYIEYEWANFNLSLVMDDPFIQPWNDVGNEAWKDFSEGGNSELIKFNPRGVRKGRCREERAQETSGGSRTRLIYG